MHYTVSIVVPCLNEACHIVQTLTALAPMRKRGVEVIVVDGGSTDETVQLARPLAERVLMTEPGRARQMNAGAAVARGQTLWFLHADSVPPQSADQLIAHALFAGRTLWGRFDIEIDGRHPLLRIVEMTINLRSRCTSIATGDQGMFVSRALFERAGRFPEINLMEDIAMSRVLKRLSHPACLRQRIRTSGRRWEKHGVLRTILLMWRLRFAYWRGTDPDTLAARYEPHRR